MLYINVEYIPSILNRVSGKQRERERKLKIRIKEIARTKKGWSLYRLAKELGLPQQTVYSWANGRTQPSYDNMDKLCGIIGCKIGELFESEPLIFGLNLAVNSD